MFILWQTYEVLIKSLKLPNIFFDIRLSMSCRERFCQDPLENWFGRQRSFGSRKDNPSMVDFGYNNNAIGNGNVADSGMIALSNDPLPCRKPKKEWKLKCK